MKTAILLRWAKLSCSLALIGSPLSVVWQTFGQEQRALLVGINTYEPRAPSELAAGSPHQTGRATYSDLDGCLNDVQAIKEVLQARFGFKPERIQVVSEGQAKREAILAAIQKHLITEAAPGDVCFFFYAGHGSRIRNLKTNKPSGMDSTLVPADSYSGVMDLRDKELARLFTKAVDKGVVLTAVFDSCHSGSIARGLPTTEKIRDLPPDPRIVSDPPDPGKPPEERGALIISATQDDNTAAEGYGDDRLPHGAFTAALLKAMRITPLNAPAEELFLSTQVILQTEKPQQVPVLAGTLERRKKPLLGVGSSQQPSRMQVAAAGAEYGRVELRGGVAIGLNPGCELVRLVKPGEKTNEAASRIQVTKVLGLAKSEAKVLLGDSKKIRAGDIFEVDRWVPASEGMLRVWVPTTDLNYAELKRLLPEVDLLRNSPKLEWVEDPTMQTPTHVLSWDHSRWQLSGVGSLGKTFRAQEIVSKITAFGSVKSKLFMSLPVPKELASLLKFGPGTGTESIQLASAPAEANYHLIGHWLDDKLAFAWVRPNSTQEDKDKNPLPVRTDWFPLEDAGKSYSGTADELMQKALRIGRLMAWLTLGSSGSSGYFPYRLALKNTQTGALKRFGDTVQEGEPYGFLLQADTNCDLFIDAVERRRVYVIGLDTWGRTQLLFPDPSRGNIGNRVPFEPVNKDVQNYPAEIPLGDLGNPTMFTVAEPFGIDTYVLLTSREEIPDPTVFISDGVRTRGGDRSEGPGSPLQMLFTNIGAPTRGSDPAVPTDWSVQRVSIRSVAKEK